MYLAVFVKNLKRQLMYRSEFLLGSGGHFLFIYIQISIWQSLLKSGSQMASQVTVQYMITYVIVANIIRQLSGTSFTAIFFEKVNNGDIAIDLIRPVNIKLYWFAEQVSEHICIAFFSCIPVLIVSSILWGVIIPNSILQMIQFSLSLLFAVLLTYYIEYTAGICIFWTKSQTYTRQIVGGLRLIFSGTSIPLWFYPDWLFRICKALPFRMMSYEPIQIYLGRLSTWESWNVLLLQLFWILVFYGLERLVWSLLKTEIVINGG